MSRLLNKLPPKLFDRGFIALCVAVEIVWLTGACYLTVLSVDAGLLP